MASYRERIETAIRPLLARGFKVTWLSEAPQSFGDSEVVVEAPHMKVQFISERGKFFVDVATLARPTKWYSLSELLELARVISTADPWQTPEEAVTVLEQQEAAILQWLSNNNFLSKLRARR